MHLNKQAMWTRVIFILLMTGMLGLSLMPRASAADSGDIKKVQETLRDKGYEPGQIDGVLGPQTREAIRQYQKSENLPVTGRLDAETAGKLGVGPESIGGSFKGAGQEVGEGGEEAGHEMKKGKPIAAGKEMGKGLGRGGKKFGKGVKKAVSPESDRGDREKKQQPEKPDNPQ
jgi:peptidoglycan hydrolase-like protein with peptidoglycan-binding domain